MHSINDSAPTQSRGHTIADIEALRAIAVLFTIYHHGNQLTGMRNWEGHPVFGFVFSQHFAFWGGVDLFLCISGFVITRQLLHWHMEAQTERRSLRGFLAKAMPFWTRRAFRIIPASWLWLLIPFLGLVICQRPDLYGTVKGYLGDALSVIVNIANYHHYACQWESIFPCNKPTTLGHYWSLSLEEQFYILYPPFLYFMPRRRVVPGLALLAGIELLLPQSPVSFLWQFRFGGLLLGCLIAFAQSHPLYAISLPRFFSRKRSRRLAIALFIALLAFMPRQEYLFCATGLTEIVGAVLVLIATHDRDYFACKGWARRALMWIGSRSYGLYLAHPIAFIFTKNIWLRLNPDLVGDRQFSWQLVLTAAFLLPAMVEASYRLVEMPLRRRGKRVAAEIAAKRQAA